MGLGKLWCARKTVGLLCCFAVGALAQEQGGKRYTAADYQAAEKMLAYNVAPLVYHGVQRPVWVEGNRFWYRDRGPEGFTTVLVDAAKGSSAPAFDHAKMAAAVLAAKPGTKVDEHYLRVSELSFEGAKEMVTLAVAKVRMRCEISGEIVCKADEAKGLDQEVPGGGSVAKEVLSPDGSRAAFIRGWNLWMRDTRSGKETQLTKDGVTDFGYATDNAGWKHSDAAILVWSPDSRKIATFQQDQRKTGEMYLVPVTNRHPKLEAWKYPLVGDKDVTLIERVVIDVDKRKVVRFKMPPDQHRSTICDDVSCDGGWEDVQWAEDGKHIAFVSTSRDHKQEWLRVADAKTGDVREVYTETAPKFFESGDGKVNWHYLPATNEFLWFSEREGWGQMYLYDLGSGRGSGKLKNAITGGEGNVAQVLSVDEKARRISFIGVGKERGWDPYYRAYYSVGFDGSGLKLLTPEEKDHAVTASPDGKYFVDIASTPTEPQVTVVRDAEGKVAAEVAKQDISKLMQTGWKPLTPVTVKGRDGSTDIYGYMFKPTTFDASKRYPVVNYVYPGPQIGSCGSRGFSAAHEDNQALAELGFVVVCLDGMGTPSRSKAFHAAYFGDLGDNTLPDQVAGMKELAAKFPFIDLERAGMWGHSGGGNATGAAMLHYPEFFKVGIAESGNHDQRDYEDDWAEKWAGVEVVGPDGKSNYDSQANQNFAKNLKGHLLLAHGTMDDNVPPNNTLLLVDALIKANKDFDLLLIPNVHHGYGEASPYMMRRRWDYFVRYLAGATPPKDYEMTSFAAAQKKINGPVEDGWEGNEEE